MLKEYDCWMQQRKVECPAGLALGTVYENADGEIAAQAGREFRRGIERLLGFSPAAAPVQDTGEPKPGVYLATISALKKHFSFPAEKLVDGGFFIQSVGGTLVIAGQDDAGIIYGVFHFLSLLARGKACGNLSITEEPVSLLRIINHWDNLDGTIERGYAGLSIFYNDNHFDYDRERITDYARMLASVGINRLSINNVNVRGAGKLLIADEYLDDVATLAAIFRPFSIRLLLSINFGAPWSQGKLPTADPLDPAVAAWWKERAARIYARIPDLAGFLVKADSEGEPGPFQYGRTHVDGANMLAKALNPHGGEVIWRCFVYNCVQDWRDRTLDRARAAYDNFMPFDGMFDNNVILQIKFGPYDFQVREPVTPLFGALKNTRHLLELQITQEYTGHQIDHCYLPWAWQDVLEFDTAGDGGTGNRVKDLVGPNVEGRPNIEGLAAVVNVGRDVNWTGHTLAQANLYGYGRMAWNPGISAKEIAEEWSLLSFGAGTTAEAVADIQLRSYPAYEKCNAPFGVCFMVTPHTHYGPNIEGYEFSRWGTYHRADSRAIGIDRTPAGTGYTTQYSPANAAMFGDPARCPENLLLFFHRLNYDYKMKNGETLLQNIYDTHFDGYGELEAIVEKWKALESELDKAVYRSVLERFGLQIANAREWRDQINTYFFRRTGIADKRGRRIYG